MKVTIEYCAQWNYKPRASSLEAALKQAFSEQVEVTLIPGSDGIFKVTLDGKLLFSKKEVGRFPESPEIVGLMQDNV